MVYFFTSNIRLLKLLRTVKCPYKTRLENPRTYKFDFLDSDGLLKESPHYYYQIQGILEVTDRKWCDLVIYTFLGLRITRVLRKKAFWNAMLKKLKEFYLYHMLPALVFKEEGFTYT